MKFARLSIAVLIFEILFLSFGFTWLPLQPIVIFVLAFGFRLDVSSSVFLLIASGVLREWFNPGAGGEVFASYLLLALGIAWFARSKQITLRATGNVLSLLVIFSLVMVGSVYLMIASNPSVLLGVVALANFTSLVLINAVIVLPLHIYNLKQANGQL